MDVVLETQVERDPGVVAGRPTRHRRWAGPAVLLALLTAVAVVAAVLWATSDGGEPDDRVLVLDEDGAVSLLDPASGTSVFSVPGAVVTPDRSALLTTRSADGETVLESHDPATGEVTGSTRLDGALSVRTVSPGGGAVALLPGERGSGLYEPASRERTSLTVSYTDSRPPRTYDLEGNFEPEMFSLDETALFLIQFDPATEPSGYFVRMLDLASGAVTDTGAPPVELNSKIRGKARAQVLHPDGTHLYTLYTLPDGVTGEAADGGEARSAFIHVIQLDEKWSYCIFLPDPIGAGDESMVGMGISPDGSSLYVADPGTSTLARVDAIDLEVDDVRPVEKLRPYGSKAAVTVAPDGLVYVGSGSRVLELAGDSLEPVHTFSGSYDVTGLGVSASGAELRVGGGGEVAILDRATRQETGVLRAPGGGTVTLLGPPRGSVTEFPLECAC